MAEDQRFTASLQQSVLAALCFDGPSGTEIAAQVKPEHFDGIWRDFVTRVLLYRKRYGKPPGENYTEDLAAQASFGKDDSVLRKKLLPQLFAEAEGLNAQYAASRVQEFVRRQVIKGALFEAGARFAQNDDKMLTDVEGILHRALKYKQSSMDAGVFLNDPRALGFLNRREDVIPLGIPELDRLGIGLISKQLLLYLGPKGSGKSWFCVHCGKQGLIHRQKVVHYSLEMDDLDMVTPRYYQALFGMAKRPDRYDRTLFELDELGRFAGFNTKSVRPKFDFTQPGIVKTLRGKIKNFGLRFSNLVVKSFPTGSLTMSQLTGHLDYLEEVEGFVPNLVIVDYPKLMHMDRRNLRIDLGRNLEELRGLAVERNFALVCPHQGTRETIGGVRTRSSDAGEDISVVQTADTVLAYSRTEAEERIGLGRLGLEHARDTKGGAMVLLSQAYTIGQYVMASAPMNSGYWDHLRKAAPGFEEE